MNKEIIFIIRVFDQVNNNKKDYKNMFNNLKEQNLIVTLKKNNVVVKFEHIFETGSISKDNFFYKFPHIKVFYKQMHTKLENDIYEFKRIKRNFSKKGIEFMLFKSDGCFPYESDNLDTLIKPNKLEKVVQLLKDEGYSELPKIREPNKFLFRKNDAPCVLPLHIHAKVEWEGTQFIDLQNLWNRKRISEDNLKFCIPSPEDCILITSAHLFFENHEVKLDDLLKIYSCIQKASINWDYIFDHAHKMHWGDALCLSILLLNFIFKTLYGQNMFPNNVLSKSEELCFGYKIILKMIKPLDGGSTLLKIPYGIVSIFFILRVIRDTKLTLVRRFKHLCWITCDIIKRRIENRY